MTFEFLTRLEAHIVKALLETSLFFLRNLVKSRNILCDTDTHTRVGTICNTRFDIHSIESQFLIEYSVIATLQGFPISHSLIPIFTLRSIFATLDVLKSCLIRSHETTTSTHLDREVTESQTTFHRHVLHNIATILDEVTGSTRSSELTHQIERHILSSYTLTELTIDADTHRLWFALENTL